MSFDQVRASAIRDPGSPDAYWIGAAAWLTKFEWPAYLRVVRWAELAGAPEDLVERSRDRARRIEAGRGARKKAMVFPTRAVKVDMDGKTIHFAVERQVSGDFFVRVLRHDEHGFQTHEPGLQRAMKRLLGPGTLFVDAGAHIGYFSCYAAALGATVMAVEIQPTLCDAITANAAINEAWRIHTLCAALGETPGLAQVWRMEPRPGMQIHSEKKESGWCHVSSINHDLIPVVTLDQMMAFPAAAGPRSTLIKIDVEGAEGKVLAGARGLIDARRASFVVECHLSLMTGFGTAMSDIVDLFPEEHWRYAVLEETRDRELDRDALMRLVAGRGPGAESLPGPILFSPRD